jgi:glycosyltransferase involved in cell wall biosynthesis
MRTDFSPGALPTREHLPAGDAGTPVLDVVIPVYNEEKDLRPCVVGLYEHLRRTFPYAFRITIADNASTDSTPRVAARLAAEIAEVGSFRLEQKGRGLALRTVWSASDAPILAYMDVHRPQRAAAAGGSADLGPLRSGDRFPARPDLPRRARSQA